MNSINLSKTICLSGRDELYLVNLDLVLYMQADDHYTHIYYTTNHHFLVPYGLSAIEQMIRDMKDDSVPLMRLGRKYIINLQCIHYVSILKGSVSLSDLHGGVVVLHISKPILRSMSSLFLSK